MMLKYKFFIALVLISGLLNGQHLQKTISLNAQNKPLLEILEEIERQAKVTFSYNSNILDKNEIITLEATDMSIAQVLDAIFNGHAISYNEIGNQIVLYYDTEKNQVETGNKKTPELRTIIINDTVYKYFNTTNVKVFDTVRYVFFDTIRHIAEKPKTLVSFDLGAGLLSNFPGIEANSMKYDNFAKILIAGRNGKPGPSFHSKMNFLWKNVMLSTGFIYSTFSENVSYQSEIISPVEKTVTSRTWVTYLDTSYFETRPNTGGGGGGGGFSFDTTWYIFYEKVPFDTTRIVVTTDTSMLSVKSLNTYNSFTFPVNVAWRINLNRKWAFDIGTGPAINILIPKKGLILNPDNEGFIEDFSTVPFIKINLMWQINTGIFYALNKDFSLYLQTNYFNNLQSAFSSDFPFSWYNRNINIALGIRYFL